VRISYDVLTGTDADAYQATMARPSTEGRAAVCVDLFE
jgi:hypothetical protein